MEKKLTRTPQTTRIVGLAETNRRKKISSKKSKLKEGKRNFIRKSNGYGKKRERKLRKEKRGILRLKGTM